MKKEFFICLSMLILAMIFPGFASQPESFDSLLKEVKRIELKTEDAVFASIDGILPVKEGYVALVNESSFGSRHKLLKFSKDGKLGKTYAKRGNGPGEFRAIANFIVKDDYLLVAERSSPYIHKISSSLDFLNDYRIKSSGNIKDLGNFVGIWSARAVGEGKDLRKVVLALYDSKSMEFVKYAFEIEDIPSYVFTMGGVCPLPGGGYAGVFSNEFQIKVFDDNLNFKSNLLSRVPKHAVRYIPWKKSPYNLGNEGFAWIKSWSKMHSIYYIKDTFLLLSVLKNMTLIDVISKEGKYLKEGLKMAKGHRIVFTEGNYLWLLVNEEEGESYKLVKNKLIL